jgi:prepilin-type N-terminal cleavage/methylation domain-containing protein
MNPGCPIPDKAIPRTRRAPKSARSGFTLIELMVAIAIGALLMMTAIPAIRASRKPPLILGVNTFVDACKNARARAILTGRPMQVVVYGGGSDLLVEPAPSRQVGAIDHPLPGDGAIPDSAPPSASRGPGEPPPLLSTHFPDDVAFRTIRVNGRDMEQSDAAAIRFYPNGTSDALLADLQWQRMETMRITLDIITGIPETQAVQ